MSRYRFTNFKTLKSKLFSGSFVIALAFLALTSYRAVRAAKALPIVFAATGFGTYTTSFPLTQNPISENGNWINGQTTGLDWSNVETTPGFAFGTESGSINYNDSTAVVAGSWGPNQTVQATIYSVNQPTSSSVFEEVELRVRTTIAAHNITGYEINFSCSANSNNYYAQIVRWNGPLGSFTQLDGANYHCVNGDVVKATISGNTITAYVNNQQIMQITDNTFSSGSPGIGMYLQGAGVNNNHGFSTFTATDGTSTTSLSAPTSLSAIVN